MPNTATQKQIDFINSLKAQRDLTDAYNVLEMARNLWRIDAFTTQAASTVIDALKGLPYAQAPAASSTSTPEGMHVLDGKVYKVQVAKQGSGNLYAKILVIEEPDCGGCANGEPCGAGCKFTAKFEYAPGVIKRLSEATRMSAEESAKFGALYGVCCNCAADLTDERSIQAGYGPICAKNNGWPWG